MVTSGGLRWSPWLCLFLVIGWTLSVSSAQTHEKRIRLVRNGNTIRTRLSANVPVRRSQQQVNRRSRVRAVPINPTDLGGYAPAPTTGYSTQSQAGYVRQQGQGGYGQVEQMTESGYEEPQQQSSPRQNAYSSQSQNSPVSQQPQRSSQTSQRQQQQQQQQQEQGYIYNQPQRSQQSGVNRPSQSSRRPAPVPDPVNDAQIITDEPEQPLPVQPEQDYTQQTEQPYNVETQQPYNVETEQRIDADSILPDSTATPIDIMRTTARAQTSSSSGHSDDGSYHHSMDDFWPDGYKGVIPGEEGVDYPVYNTIPETSFSCSDQSYSGYYADVEARCQVFHVCLRRATRRSIEKWSFLCPNGTVFSQEDFVCVWWNQAQSCDSDTLGRLYELNARLGWDSHDESGMKSIQTIMQSMMTAPTTPAKTLLQQPDLSQGGFDQDVRPTRIPVRLSASLGNQGNGGIRKVNVETSVPVTMITPDDIVTSSPQNDYDGQSQVEIDSQPVVDTSLTSNSESQSRTKTASAFLKSQSEAYEQFGDPDGLENPKPFIVNNPPVSQDNSLEEPSVGAQGTDGDGVPTLMMLPVQQQYPDGTTTVVDMPIMVISNKQRPVVGFPPAAVVNPNGVTIPNRPVQPPRSYLPPRRDPTTTQPTSVNTVETTVPVQVEEEVSQSYDYVDTDKEPPGTRPVVEYEVNSDAPEPVTPEAITDKPSNTYLPPRGQRPAILTGPDPDFALPIQNDVQTDAPVTSTLAPVIEDETLQTEGPSYVPVDRPVTTYRPAPPTSLPQLVRRPQVQTTFTAMQGDVVNQILQSGVASGTVNEQSQATTDSRRNEDEVQYPTPGYSEVNQDSAPNVGTSAQLYNGNVRNIYRQNSDAKSTTTELPTYDKDRNNQLLQQIQNGGYGSTGTGNDLSNNLEQITPGYIELPRGTEPTESSRAELPGTESVQAFLTSQKNVDQKQTLQIYEFNKYALFVPKEGQNEVSGGYSLPSGTPAPAGLVQSSPTKSTTPNPQRNIENLFGPRAKDVLNQIKLVQTSQPQQPRGYSNAIVPVPSKPSGLYETPNKEFKGYQQSNVAQPRPQNVQVRPTSQPVRQPQSQQQVSSQQQRPQQGGYSQQQQRPQQGGYSQPQQQQRPQSQQQQQSGYSQQQATDSQQQRPQQQQNGYSQQVTQQQAQQQRPQQQQNGYSQQVVQQQAQQQQPQQQQNGYSQQLVQQQAQQKQPQQQQVQQQRPQQAKPQQQQSGYSLQQQQRPQSPQQSSSLQQQQNPQQQNVYRQPAQNNPSQGYSIVPTVARPPSNLYLPPTQQSGQQQIIAQQPGFTLAGPQIQLPVYVESHTTQTVQIPTPAPQSYQPQQQQQQQQQAPQGYQLQQQQQQQAPQGYQPQQQQQQPQAPQGYQLQQQQQAQQGYQPQQQASPVSAPSQQAPPVPRPASPSYFYAPPTVDEALNLLQPQSSSLSNNIQIPDGDIRIPQLTEIRGNGAEFIPAIPVHSQTIVETRKVPQQNQQQVAPALLQQQYPQFAPVSTPGPIQQQFTQLSQVAPQGYNNILGPNAHVVNSAFTQAQPQFFSHLSHAAPQIQAPQQQQSTFHPIPNPNTHVSVQRAALQPVDISALNVAYPSAVNYESSIPQPSSGGYRDVQRFNAQEAVHTPSQHQNFFEGHQDSHQQSVQNFLQQTRLQAQQSSQNLQHLSLASSQSTVAVPPPKGFYPGKDKSIGVRLTY